MYNMDYDEDFFYGLNIYNQDEINQDTIDSSNNGGNMNQFMNYSLILLSNVFARLFR